MIVEGMKPFYQVTYVDDFKVKHLTIAKTQAELSFIQNRFDKVNYEHIVPTKDGNLKVF
jgi:hypothetical protein